MAITAYRRKRPSGPGQPVHRLGQLDVTLGQATGIMSRERHRDGLIDIEPFRMVVELLGDQRGPRHESERLIEVAEYQGLGDGIAVLDLTPTRELGERRLAGISGQFIGHRCTPVFVCTVILTRLHAVEPLAIAGLNDYLP